MSLVIATYGDLKDAVKNECMRQNHRGFAEALPRMVAFAENRIFNGAGRPFETPPLRVRELENAADPLTFTNGSATLPDDYLDARLLLWDGDIKSTPTYEEPSTFRLNRSTVSVGYPTRYTIEGSAILLSPKVSGDLTFVYYARPAAFADDDDSNAVLLAYPDLYFQAVLIEAYGFIRAMDRKSDALAAYTSIINGIGSLDVRRKTGNMALYPRVRRAWV